MLIALLLALAYGFMLVGFVVMVTREEKLKTALDYLTVALWPVALLLIGLVACVAAVYIFIKMARMAKKED